MPKRMMNELSDEARLWAFAAGRRLSASESSALVAALDRFIEQWSSHGAPVRGASEMHDGTLLLVAGEEEGNPSGCSVDRLFGLLKDAGSQMGVDLVDSGRVVWRDDSGSLHSGTRPEFRRLAESGEISGVTRVIDLGVESLGDLRNGRLEKPASESWHAEAFALR